MADNKQLVVFVSSTVYGIEELLELIYSLLSGFGYEVWMSHKGTIPVFPSRTALDNCLYAVEKCDLFLNLITTHYGSGRENSSALSITHRELLRAIELNKPRWILAHDHVVFARRLLINLGYDDAQKRASLQLKKNDMVDDLRVIDMYEAAIRHDVRYVDRSGNWVQKYVVPADAALYASAQFHRYQEVESFLRAHCKPPAEDKS